jgi:predicted metal-dependent hydrolase
MTTVESDIVVRRVDFDFDPERVPKRWYRNDLFLSLFDDALSLLFPEGERFFVESVKRYKHRITDPDLLRRVTAFSAQEAMHGKEHRAFNEMLRAQGFKAPEHLEAHLSRLLDRVRLVLPPIGQLAVTCALEHFTAILAEQLLSTDDVRNDMHPSVRRLWEWHALEESEHRAVAFDVYRAVGGGYLLRTAIMIVTTIVFFFEVTHFHARLLAEERALFDVRGWIRSLFHLWIHPGHFGRLLPGYLDYYRPRFHPHDRDTTTLLADWKARFALSALP